LQHPLKYGAIGFGKSWSNTTFSGKTVTIVDAATGGSATTVTGIFPRDLIEEYLPLLGESSNVYYSSELYSSNYTTTTVIDQEEILIPFYNANSFPSATNLSKQIALSESSIIGNILGNAFYTPRFKKDASAKATLGKDDFESLELDYSFRNVRYLTFNYQFGNDTEGTSEPNVSTNGAVLINDFGTSNVSIEYGQFTDLWPVEKDSSNINWEFGLDEYNVIAAGFVSNVIASYKQIFQISNTAAAGISISGTILGIDKLKPYEYFTVSSGVNPLVDGKDFRPSYLKFNLKEDKIEFEAYSF
jgi:hypothetical protein